MSKGEINCDPTSFYKKNNRYIFSTFKVNNVLIHHYLISPYLRCYR